MLDLSFKNGRHPLRRILCLGAHCDDIEIGCGGTILRLAQNLPRFEIHWVVFTASPERRREAFRCARLFLKNVHSKQIVVHSYRDGFLPYNGQRVKEDFEQLKKLFSPDLVFTHYRHDLHQDHRLICELTWNTFRNHLILEYEIPKYDGDMGTPNLFVNLTESLCAKKIRLILKAFKTQRNKHWFTEETFRSLLRLRGIEANGPGKYAEAFYCRKLTL
jgi:LmbE family N-acetylglucosaminyl deacetylase